MKELMIVKEIAPVIEVNFEEVKQSMVEVLEQYKGYVVTEDNLKSCKETQKELAGVRIQIDKYRKEKKAELSKPISAFEDKMKELVSLVESAEVPIKQGIQVFDDKRRLEKIQIATAGISNAVESRGLKQKYASRLTIIDKYSNLTAVTKDIIEDIEARADALLNEQKNEEAMLEVIQISIDTANQSINAKLSIEDFKRSIENGVSAKDIIGDINARAERIRISEMPKPEPVVVPVIEEDVTPIVKEESANHFETPIFEAPKEKKFEFEVKITATEQQLRLLKQFLLTQEIEYQKVSLQEVE